MPPVAEVYHFRVVPVADNCEAVSPCVYVTGEATVGAVGSAIVVTTISARGLSCPLTVWLTKYDLFPTVCVDGVGAVLELVPPVALVYHFRAVPVAVSGTAVSFWQ